MNASDPQMLGHADTSWALQHPPILQRGPPQGLGPCRLESPAGRGKAPITTLWVQLEGAGDAGGPVNAPPPHTWRASSHTYQPPTQGRRGLHHRLSAPLLQGPPPGLPGACGPAPQEPSASPVLYGPPRSPRGQGMPKSQSPPHPARQTQTWRETNSRQARELPCR